MKCIDFDKQFMAYTERWMAENMSKYENVDAMEAEMPEVYMRWLNQPASWLDGATPGEYFVQFDDADALVEWTLNYERQGIDVPDMLLERIVDLGEVSIAPLMKLSADKERSTQSRMMALNMLRELDSDAPLNLAIELILEHGRENELADVAAELLSGIGHEAVEPILSKMEEASEDAQITFLDVLCNFPGDERIYTYTVNMFLRRDDLRGLLASYLSKLGDERAVEPLKKVLKLSDLKYLDYIEVRNAIEALGGEVEEEREFSGDTDYEWLKSVE